MPNHSRSGFHHAYTGLCLMLLGFWAMWHSVTVAVALMALGFLLFADDAIQHYVGLMVNPLFQSPLHRLYGILYKHSLLVRKLNRFFDKLFGA